MVNEKKVWYVEFPTYRYKEDVKDIARIERLVIVDAKYQGDESQVANAPKLTLLPKYTPEKEK